MKTLVIEPQQLPSVPPAITGSPWHRAVVCVRTRRYYRMTGRIPAIRTVTGSLYRFRERWTREQRVLAAGAAQLFLVPGVTVASCVGALDAEGVGFGLKLSPAVVEVIADHARTSPCGSPHGGDGRFAIADVRNARLPDGSPMPIADVIHETSCRAIDDIARDGLLVELVRQHFGYAPRRVVHRLFWSLAGDLPDETRRQLGQTIDYHYDIERRRSIYAYFYISGGDRFSGAHVVVPGSHRIKPLSIVLSSCFQPEATVLRYYGADRPRIVEGEAGFGFLENPACFHKVIPPRVSDRLMLQLRYS